MSEDIKRKNSQDETSSDNAEEKNEDQIGNVIAEENSEDQMGNASAEENSEDRVDNVNGEENSQDQIDNDDTGKSEQQTTDKKDENKISSGKKLFNDITDIIETVGIWLLIFLLIRAYLFDQATVDGTSMVPTLEDTQRIIYSKIYSPDNGDIVIVKNEKLGPLVKRVIAVGGQKLDIRDGYVYVDDEQLDEQLYVEGEKLTGDHFITSLTEVKFNVFRQPEEYPLTIPDGYIFVMGDNRCVSNDSRSSDVGFVSEDDVIGKVVMRYLPLNTIKFFK